MYDFTGVNTKYLSGPISLAPPFTVACWGRQDAVVSSKNTVFYIGDSASDLNFWQLYTDNSSPPKMGIIMRDGGTFSGNLSALTAPLGQLNLYGMTVPASPANCYAWINGTQSAGISNGVAPSAPNILGLGCTVGTTKQQPWDGGIAEVAVWNVLLTTDDWAQLADGISPDQVKRANLVFYRALIRDLNYPYAPGGNLTNTGSVGVIPHPPMSYESLRRRVFAVPATIPGAPSLAASAYAPHYLRVTLTHGDNGGSPILYTHIEYRETLVGGAYTGSTTIAGAPTTHMLSGLSAATQYDIRARVENALGVGPYSSVVTQATPDVANAEALALIAFGHDVMIPPFFGDGSWSQEDAQQVLGIPIDPVLIRFIVRDGAMPYEVGQTVQRSATGGYDWARAHLVGWQPPIEWSRDLQLEYSGALEWTRATEVAALLPIESGAPPLASAVSIPMEWGAEYDAAATVLYAWGRMPMVERTIPVSWRGLFRPQWLVPYEYRPDHTVIITRSATALVESTVGVRTALGAVPHAWIRSVHASSALGMAYAAAITKGRSVSIEGVRHHIRSGSLPSESGRSTALAMTIPSERIGLVKSARRPYAEHQASVLCTPGVPVAWIRGIAANEAMPHEFLGWLILSEDVRYEVWGVVTYPARVVPFEHLSRV